MARRSHSFQLDPTHPMEEGTRIRLPPPVLMGGGHNLVGERHEDTGTDHNVSKSTSSSRSGTASTSTDSNTRAHHNITPTTDVTNNAGIRACATGANRREAGLRERDRDDHTFSCGSAPPSVIADTLMRATMRQQRHHQHHSSPSDSSLEPRSLYSYRATEQTPRVRSNSPPISRERYSSQGSAPLPQPLENLLTPSQPTTALQSIEDHSLPFHLQQLSRTAPVPSRHHRSSNNRGIETQGHTSYVLDSTASTPSPPIDHTLASHRANRPQMYANATIDTSTPLDDLAATTTASLSFSHSHAVSADDSYGEVFNFVNSAHALGWRVENPSPSATKTGAHDRSVSAEPVPSSRSGRSLSLRPPSAAVAEVNVHLMQQIADRFETSRARK